MAECFHASETGVYESPETLRCAHRFNAAGREWSACEKQSWLPPDVGPGREDVWIVSYTIFREPGHIDRHESELVRDAGESARLFDSYVERMLRGDEPMTMEEHRRISDQRIAAARDRIARARAAAGLAP